MISEIVEAFIAGAATETILQWGDASAWAVLVLYMRRARGA